MTESVNTFVPSVNNTPNYNLFKNTNFYYSEIISLTVKDINNNIISENRKKYQTVLKDIWSTMRKEVLLEKTTYNMREINENNVLPNTNTNNIVHSLSDILPNIINLSDILPNIINESDRSRFIINSLQLSIRCKEAKGAIKEIINMIKVNNYSIEMYLKLKNNHIFYYKY